MRNEKGLYVLGALMLLALGGCSTDRRPASSDTIQLPLVQVSEQDVPVNMQFAGQVYGYRTVPIDARAAGYLRTILFREGAFVHRGQLLYLVDAAPYAAQTQQSEAALERAAAQLLQAQQNYDRIKPLAGFNAASANDLDAATASLSAAKSAHRAAQAVLVNSQIELGYTRLDSPVDGIIGQTQAQIGAFVGAGSGMLTLNTVSQVDSVKVDFFIPETLYLRLKSTYGDIHLNELTLQLSSGEEYPHQGRFNFLGRAVEPQTGALNVEAIFPNPDTLLRPGQFALVGAVVDTLKSACLIPQKAINQIQGHNFVYTVASDGVVTQRSITLGQAYGSQCVVTSGLKPQESVITEGFHKLRPGVKVTPLTAKTN